jgi:nucleotide-binding universal stress UspA family protein
MSSPILCGVDGSSDARSALRAASQLAAQLGVKLVVAHVVQPSPASHSLGPAVGPAYRPLPDQELEAGRALVRHVVAEEGLHDVEQRAVFGFPADRLADLADEENAELIVVGSRGRGSFKAAFLGSVSTSLIGVARCPVLVVPPGAARGATARAAFGRATV